MSFTYFFQCFSEISECRYLMRHQHESTTSSMSYWSVRRDHQDADRAKRSTKHDFETQQAMNQSTSRLHQETWWARDQLNDNKHLRRDYHRITKESIEFQKETAFNESVSISTVYEVLSFYRESYLTRVVHSIRQWSSQVLQVFKFIYIHWWRWINMKQLKNQDRWQASNKCQSLR